MTDSLLSECVEWTGATRNGYGVKRYEGKVEYVHRLSFTEFHGRKPNGVVRHKCNNRLCYRGSHLEDGTRADNSRDMVERGRSMRGERHSDAILDVPQVREIRDLYDARPISVNEIAKSYGISRQNVTSIGKRKSWTHV